jgi:hypothetical protein
VGCCPENSHFFESLKSQRRLTLCAEANARLCAHARRVLPDALAAFPCLAHLTVNDQQARKKEHDMRGLKRLEIATLRQGAPKGRKVLHVWDRAGIDFRQWYKWKQGSGIYMLSRCKTNMVLLPCGNLPFVGDDVINAGVLRDELVGTEVDPVLRPGLREVKL